MFNITNNGVITLSRGDFVQIPLFINQGTDLVPIRYNLTDSDIVYVGVCLPNQSFENAVLRKKYDKDNRELNKYGDLIITLNSQDTEFLESGLYYYIVKLNQVADNLTDRVTTLIQKTKFYIED